jgi:hypothetical protein
MQAAGIRITLTLVIHGLMDSKSQAKAGRQAHFPQPKDGAPKGCLSSVDFSRINGSSAADQHERKDYGY